MARKRTKEEAKKRVRDLPIIPNLRLPIGGPTLGELAEGFIDLDPLNRLGEAPSFVDRRNRPVQGPINRPLEEQVMMSMVNDPEFTLTQEDVKMINDPNRMLLSSGNGNLMEVSGRDVIRNSGQFSSSSLLFGIGLGLGDKDKEKRSRKKTKTDKNMSKALSQANSELRTKNGKLRKGKTQADVMRRAHRLRKKMK